MKKLLLAGDSIRMNYQPRVFERLSGKVNIYAPQSNAKFSSNNLWFMHEWLKENGTPDIVHWNVGIWDVYRFDGEGRIFSSKELYAENLLRTFQLIEKTGAVNIFATTTPVHYNNKNVYNSDIDEFNNIAEKVFKECNIIINDLNILIRDHLDRYICSDLMHLSPDGIKVCGDKVADIIEKYL